MKISNEVRKYIELALRQKIKDQRPDYSQKVIDKVVAASIASMGAAHLNVNSDTLYMAIDLAIKDQRPGGTK